MVIIHLADNQRRVISANNGETVDQLCRRFCNDFGYSVSEFSLFGLFSDAPLPGNVFIADMKEVRLMRRPDSRRGSQDSCYSSIDEKSPTSSLSRSVAPPRPAAQSVSLCPSNTQMDRVVKRSAPPPPPSYRLIPDKSTDDVADIYIPAPPSEPIPSCTDLGPPLFVASYVECVEDRLPSPRICGLDSNNSSSIDSSEEASVCLGDNSMVDGDECMAPEDGMSRTVTMTNEKEDSWRHERRNEDDRSRVTVPRNVHLRDKGTAYTQESVRPVATAKPSISTITASNENRDTMKSANQSRDTITETNQSKDTMKSLYQNKDTIISYNPVREARRGTINSTIQDKDTINASNQSKDTMDSSNQIEKMKKPSNQSQEMMKPSNQSRDTMDSSNQSKDTMKLSNTSQDMMKPSNQSQEKMKPSNQSQEMMKPSNRSKDTIKVSNQSQEMMKPSNQNRDTMDSSNQSKDMMKPSNQSQEMMKLSNQSRDTMKPSNQSRDTMESSNQSRDTLESSNQSKDTMKPSNQSQEMMKPSNQSRDTMESSNQSKDTMKPSNQSRDTMKPSNQSRDTLESSNQSRDTLESSNQSKDTTESSNQTKSTTHPSKSSASTSPMTATSLDPVVLVASTAQSGSKAQFWEPVRTSKQLIFTSRKSAPEEAILAAECTPLASAPRDSLSPLRPVSHAPPPLAAVSVVQVVVEEPQARPGAGRPDYVPPRPKSLFFSAE